MKRESRAKAYARRRPRDLRVGGFLWFVDDEGRLLVNNAGPFPKRSVRRIIRWLRENFE
jgi:hypothetical protein